MTLEGCGLPARHPQSPPSRFEIAAKLVGLAGIVSLFLPFTSDVAPISATIDHSLWRLALPFSLAVLVSAAFLRRLFTGALSQLECAAGYFAAAGAALVTLSLFVVDFKPSGARDWASVAAGLLTVIAGGGIVVRNWRNDLPHSLNCLVSMQVAYLANSLLCLVAFWGEWQVGAYTVLLTVLVYVADVAGVSLQGVKAKPPAPAAGQAA
jgi:hypothetical protein